jgi:hypothetical protein
MFHCMTQSLSQGLTSSQFGGYDFDIRMQGWGMGVYNHSDHSSGKLNSHLLMYMMYLLEETELLFS